MLNFPTIGFFLLVCQCVRAEKEWIAAQKDVKAIMSTVKGLHDWTEEYYFPSYKGMERTVEISIQNEWKNGIGLPWAHFTEGGLKSSPNFIPSGKSNSLLIGNVFSAKNQVDLNTKGFIAFKITGVHLAELVIGFSITSSDEQFYIGYFLDYQPDEDSYLNNLKVIPKNTWSDFKIANDLYISAFSGTGRNPKVKINLYQKDLQLHNDKRIVEEGIYYITMPVNQGQGFAYLGGPTPKLSEPITSGTSKEHAWNLTLVDSVKRYYKLELLDTGLYLGYYYYKTSGVPDDEAYWLAIEGSQSNLPQDFFYWNVEKDSLEGFRISPANIQEIGIGLSGSFCKNRWLASDSYQACKAGGTPKLNKLEDLTDKNLNSWSYSSLMLEDYIMGTLEPVDTDL
jgi:hypothetical protein